MISAIVLAAGESRRMGEPKLLLPWGETTVLGQVVASCAAAGLEEILIITGGYREQVESLVRGLASTFPVRSVYNPDFSAGEMLSSLQVGLEALGREVQAAMIVLGDQPQIRPETIRNLSKSFETSPTPLIIPSHAHRRGHPWLAARSLWPELLGLPPGATARAFLEEKAGSIRYIPADRTILLDLDTPRDYLQQHP
jgi:molybdenum cofactor cytidylyltransferase